MDFFKHLLGSQTIGLVLAGLFFCISGAIVMKAHYYYRHKAQCKVEGNYLKFDWLFWIKDNYVDILLSIILSFIGVRFLDVFLHWVNPRIESAFGWSMPVTEDQVLYYLAFGAFVQWWLHTKYKSKALLNKQGFTGGGGDLPPDQDEDINP